MKKIITLIILCLLFFGGAYVYWFYYNTYSDGLREGVLQKFSRKGNVFKTHEGEMLLLGFGSRNGNIRANYFSFSVTDPIIADSLEKCIGKSVKLHYNQYRRALPWRGDLYNNINQENGQYIIDQIIEVSEANMDLY